MCVFHMNFKNLRSAEKEARTPMEFDWQKIYLEFLKEDALVFDISGRSVQCWCFVIVGMFSTRVKAFPEHFLVFTENKSKKYNAYIKSM